MKSPREKRELLQSQARDETGKLISTSFGLRPVYDVFRMLVKPLYQQKADEWETDIMTRLADLEKAGKVDLTKLKESEEFNAVLTKAFISSMQTHQVEKRNALKNIVVNSAINIDQSFEHNNLFFSFIDQMLPVHIFLLTIFKEPSKYFESNYNSENFDDKKDYNVFETISSLELSLQGQETIVKIVYNDLYSKGLVLYPYEHAKVTSFFLIKITPLGDKFLEYIADSNV